MILMSHRVHKLHIYIHIFFLLWYIPNFILTCKCNFMLSKSSRKEVFFEQHVWDSIRLAVGQTADGVCVASPSLHLCWSSHNSSGPTVIWRKYSCDLGCNTEKCHTSKITSQLKYPQLLYWHITAS